MVMKVRYSKILMWLLILSPIVDNINGYLLLEKKNTSISIVFKTIIFLVCLIISVQATTIRIMFRIICVILFLALQLAVFAMGSKGGTAYNISTLIKILTPIVIIMSMRCLAVYDRTVIKCIDKIADFYCWFFPISLILPKLLNIGYSTYAGAIGNKGFYFAGNEISIIMIIILVLEIEKYRSHKSKINLLNIFLGIMGMLYLGTKSVYISLMVLIVVALYSEKNVNKKVLNIAFIIPAVFGALWYTINNVNAIVKNISRIMWKYTTKSTGFINFLLSGRELRIMRSMERIYDEGIIQKIIFGVSPSAAENEMQILIEMDVLDLFIRLGLITSTIIIFFYAKYVRKAIDTKNIVYITGILLVYGASFFSGHMIFAPMVSIVLVILFLKIECEDRLKCIQLIK